jgi:hypothetical protein
LVAQQFEEVKCDVSGKLILTVVGGVAAKIDEVREFDYDNYFLMKVGEDTMKLGM